MNKKFRSIISGVGIVAGVVGAGWALIRWREPIADELRYHKDLLLEEADYIASDASYIAGEALDSIPVLYDDVRDSLSDRYEKNRQKNLETITPGFMGKVKNWFYRISAEEQVASPHLNGQVKIPDTVDTSVIETIRNRRYEDDIAYIVDGLSPDKEEERRKWRESFKKAQEAGELTNE